MEYGSGLLLQWSISRLHKLQSEYPLYKHIFRKILTDINFLIDPLNCRVSRWLTMSHR